MSLANDRESEEAWAQVQVLPHTALDVMVLAAEELRKIELAEPPLNPHRSANKRTVLYGVMQCASLCPVSDCSQCKGGRRCLRLLGLTERAEEFVA